MGGGIGMGNTCKSMADSFQCMTKPTPIKKNKNKQTKLVASYFKHLLPENNLLLSPSEQISICNLSGPTGYLTFQYHWQSPLQYLHTGLNSTFSLSWPLNTSPGLISFYCNSDLISSSTQKSLTLQSYEVWMAAGQRKELVRQFSWLLAESILSSQR